MEILKRKLRNREVILRMTQNPEAMEEADIFNCIKKNRPGMVAHNCNPNTLGGQGERIA